MESARIAAIPLFADLADTDIALIAAAAREIEVDDGQILAAEGDLGYALFAIESGTAEVSVDGERRGTLGPGDVFGEIAVVAAAHRTATVVARTPMSLLALFEPDFQEIRARVPEFDRLVRRLGSERLGG